ncbi:MAG: DUF4886 domain-containing protein [Bacilli bacterium]|nr:DUF4886 domain-containing protein [Bacilli bacterium]
MRVKTIDELELTADIKDKFSICSDSEGNTEKFALGNIINPIYRVINNKLNASYDGGVTFEPASDYIASYFRWSDNNTIQISNDNVTWSNLSEPMSNNLFIKGYVDSFDQLPTNEELGAIYMVGTEAPFHMYVKTSNSWVDNGAFTSVTAGIVQEMGDSETLVMSQKAVTDEIINLNEKNIFINGFGENYTDAGGVEVGEYYFNTTKKCIVKRVSSYTWKDIELSKNTTYYYNNNIYIYDGNELITLTDDIKDGINNLEKSAASVECSVFDKLSLEAGTINVETNGNNAYMLTRYRTKGFIYAPFKIVTDSTHSINYLAKYYKDGTYVGYENFVGYKELNITDEKYIYRLSFKRDDNGNITNDDFKSVEITSNITNKITEIKTETEKIKEIINDNLEDVEIPMNFEQEIVDKYLLSNGGTTDLSGFYVRVYSLQDIDLIHLQGNGGGVAYRYAFYSSSDINSSNAIEIGPKMSGEPYSEILIVPKNAKYFAVTYRYTWEQKITKIKQQFKSNNKRSVKILFFGNSFTLGSVCYSPFLIKDNFKENVDITIGIAFISGGTIGPTYGGVENHYQKILDDSEYTYFKYVNDSQSWVSSSSKPSDMFNDEDWDIVSFQQGSNNAPDYSTYQPYLNNCIDLISQKVSKPVKIAYLIPHADANVLSNNRELDILNSAKNVYNESITQIIIPYGTAIANARKTLLSTIGDANNLLFEGKHLQNGLPMIVANYCSIIVILNLLGLKHKSIIGINSSNINDNWVSSHKIPNASAVGNCVGVTTENCRIAEKCAIMAFKNPFTITQL